MKIHPSRTKGSKDKERSRKKDSEGRRKHERRREMVGTRKIAG